MRIRHGVKGMLKRKSRVSRTTSSLTLSVSGCGGGDDDDDDDDDNGEEEEEGEETTIAAGRKEVCLTSHSSPPTRTMTLHKRAILERFAWHYSQRATSAFLKPWLMLRNKLDWISTECMMRIAH